MEDNFLELSKFFNIHDELKSKTLIEVRAIQKAASFPYAVCGINIDSSLNIGTMIRSACLMGAEKFIIFGKRKYDRRACVGAQNYIEIEKVDGMIGETNDLNQEVFYSYMDMNNYIPVFIEQGGEKLNFMKTFFDEIYSNGKKPCLILGSESFGIDKALLAKAKYILSIHQIGVIRSLNVSSACSISLYQAMSCFN